MEARSHLVFRRTLAMGLVKSNSIVRSYANYVHTKYVPLEEQAENITFDDKQRIFASKRSSEILRALFVLKLSSYDVIVGNSLPLMGFWQRVLGKRLFENVMKKTMYSQFVAGEDYKSIQANVDNLKAHGIGTMLCVPTEEDINQQNSDLKSREPLFDRNADVIHDCIKKTNHGSFSQSRITAICSPYVLRKLTDLLAPYGTSHEKPKHLSVRAFARGLDKDVPSNSLIEALTEEENEHLKNSLQRLDSHARHCIRRNVRLVLDAEQSYLEGGIHHLILALQSKYNRSYPWVYGTYQCYRKDTYDRVISDLMLMTNEGFHFGAKLVRGAYRQIESERSVELGYENPVHDSYENTSKMYNDVLEVVLRKVAHTAAQVMIASHNEDSVKLAVQRMIDLGIPQDGRVSFAQLYGMCDQVTFLLGLKGYKVYKSVPYGAVDTTLPYLARRATENRDVTTRTSKERALLWKEIGHRIVSPAQ